MKSFKLFERKLSAYHSAIHPYHRGCLPFKKNPGQFGWKIPNRTPVEEIVERNCLPFTKNSDHGERVPFLHTAPGREN